MDRRTALRTLVSAPLAARAVVLAQRDGWTSLFNGRDLASWDTFLGKPYKLTEIPDLPKDARGEYAQAVGLNRDPRGVFSVVPADGGPAIRISGETFGALITRAEYENYHLRFDFRWGEKRWAPREDAVRDSGCCYHSVGPLGASYGFWMRSFEFQVQEGDCGDFYSLAGVIVDAEAVPKNAADPKSDLVFTRGALKMAGTTKRIIKSGQAELPNGQWNTLELYCLGQTSVHVVNGRTALILTGLRQKSDAGEVPLTKGKLQFQSEGAEVFYRRIDIRPIREIPASVFERGAWP
jgi:hypothetical protein